MQNDEVIRFLFDNHGVRGEIMHTNLACAQMLKHHNYPTPIADLMLDLSSVAVLLASTLKADATIMVQIRAGQASKLQYALVNINNDLSFYGSAKFDTSYDYSNMSFKDLVADDSVLVISVFPKDGTKYQGIVALDQNTLALCLEEYFKNSEQLDTKILLFKDNQTYQSGGMLLQIIPNIDNNKESLDHLQILASTLTNDEIFNLSLTDCLSRLFVHEQVRIFELQEIKFQCICSKEHFTEALSSLNPQDLLDLANDEFTTIKCQHCQKSYIFTKDEIMDIYQNVSNQHPVV